jgi:arylsulfatase A-like enzyme
MTAMRVSALGSWLLAMLAAGPAITAAQTASPSSGVSAAPALAADRPNILWLTSEDHGPEMGCYGDPNARTPNVDALAAKGLWFTRVWSTAPVCAPARTAIISGLYPSSSGGLHMRSMVSLPAELKLYPEFLREAGYYCVNNSKEDYNVRKPMGLWDESSPKAHWRNRTAGQPFFAIFNSTKSHESQIRTRPHQAIADPAKMRVPAYHPDTPEVRQDWAQYYDKVSEADADAGRRLKELEEAGLTGNTIVFYYGDHGSGMPRSKRWPSDSGLRVPLVVYFPEKWKPLSPKEYQPGGQSDRLVSFVDLAPTLLSIVGIKPPEWMQGHAFAGPHQTEPPAFLFGERGRMDERMDLVRSVTDGRYVYLRNYFPHVSQAQRVAYQFETPTTRVWSELFDQGKTTAAQSLFWRVPKAPEELYDLQTDRDEVRNLASSPAHREILEKLRAAQREHLFKIRDVGFLPEGEIHSRSQGSTPYQLARDEAKYPLKRIVTAAELASNLEPSALPELEKLLADSDSAVRYWGALGILMRGQNAVGQNEDRLRAALDDASPYVRIVAAEALGRYGGESLLQPALTVLRELAPPERNGVFVSMSALAAIEALGERAASLREFVRGLNPSGPSPDARFDSYVPRLIRNIAPANSDRPPSPAPKAKAKARNPAPPSARSGDSR